MSAIERAGFLVAMKKFIIKKNGVQIARVYGDEVDCFIFDDEVDNENYLVAAKEAMNFLLRSEFALTVTIVYGLTVENEANEYHSELFELAKFLVGAKS